MTNAWRGYKCFEGDKSKVGSVDWGDSCTGETVVLRELLSRGTVVWWERSPGGQLSGGTTGGATDVQGDSHQGDSCPSTISRYLRDLFQQDWVALMSKPIALFWKFLKNIFNWISEKILLKKIFGEKIFQSKKFLVKEFQLKKMQTKFLVKKNLDEIVFGNKIISVKKIFWLKKKFWLKKNWAKKNLWKQFFQNNNLYYVCLRIGTPSSVAMKLLVTD